MSSDLKSQRFSPFKWVMRFALFASLMLSFQNCGQVTFTETQPAGALNIVNPAVPNAGAPGTTSTIRLFQPAMAVRDISCLACHANIKANVVTDFGYGNSWFMNQGGDQTSYGQIHYLPVTWQSLQQIQGQVIVPTGNVPKESVAAASAPGSAVPTSPVSIAKYLSMSNIIDFNLYWTAQYWGISEPKNLALTNNVTPPQGLSPVSEQNFVYIGAPTSDQILSLVAAPGPSPWVQKIGATSSGHKGFSTITGFSGTKYISNQDTLTCSGEDIVINGTLVLNNLQIYAEHGGCRLYVNGPVFIEGPINYLNSGAAADPTSNLQITSTTMILLGVGLNPDGSASGSNLENRLVKDVRSNLYLRSAQSAKAFSTMSNSVLAEAVNIGGAILKDASQVGSLPAAKSAGGETRAKIDFQHILLNAPLIHSRYLGTVTGVIVAESAVFSLGAFSFDYDPVFQKVEVLPALPQDILCVVSDSSNCNPTQP